MPAADPVLGRAEILRAIRIRKLLEQADRESGPASVTFGVKARQLARAYPRGAALTYNGKPVLP